MHLAEDMYFIEVLDPRSGRTATENEFGELTLTNLYYEALAFIRWRTEDLAQLKYDPCICGYTHVQGRLMGRTSESVDVKGRLVTMAELEDVIYTFPESRPLPIQIIREEPQPQDKLKVRVCYHPELVTELGQYQLNIEWKLSENIGVDCTVELITSDEVKSLGHKYQRVIKEEREN